MKTKKSNLKEIVKHTRTIMLVNEIDRICDKELSLEYKIILIKEIIKQWRENEN
jgi:hypothetical protein